MHADFADPLWLGVLPFPYQRSLHISDCKDGSPSPSSARGCPRGRRGSVAISATPLSISQQRESILRLRKRSHRPAMRLLSWNCQGLGADLTGKSLKRLRKRHNPSMLFILETRQQEATLKVWKRLLKFNLLWNSHPDCSQIVSNNWSQPVMAFAFSTWENSLQCCSSPSWAWASLLEGRRVLHQGSLWNIGSGSSVKLWRDNWIPNFPNFNLKDYAPHHSEDATISSIINRNQNIWDLRNLSHLPAFVQSAIGATSFSLNSDSDTLIWPAFSSRLYSVKSGYKFLVRKSAPSITVHPHHFAVVS